jgi:tRNA nucleotidyltransferase (CCA-adding enzyme)
MDNDTIRDVKKIVYWHDYGISGKTTKKSLRRMLSKMGAQYFDSFVAIRRADMAGQSDYLADWKAMVLEELIQSHDEIIAEGNALTLKDLAIGGADLKTLGIQPGPEMGRILNDLLDKVLEDPTLNTKEQLIQLVPLN